MSEITLMEGLEGLRQTVEHMKITVNMGPGRERERMTPIENHMEDYTVTLEIAFKNIDRRLNTLQRRFDNLERKLFKR